MNSTDKIREFFQQRLRNTTPTEADWNVPSDEIWNKAKVHFPKKKNKPRPFLYLIFGIGLLLGISATLYFSKKEKQDLNIEKIRAAIDLQTNKLGHEEIATKALIEEEDLIDDTESEVGTIPAEVELRNSQVWNIDSNSVSISKQKSQKVGLEERRQTTLSTKAVGEGLVDEKERIVDGNLKDVEKQEETPYAMIEEIETPTPNKNIKTEKRDLMDLNHLPVLNPKVEGEENKNEMAGIEALKIKPRRKINRWEIGLSYAPFFLLQNEIFEEETPKNQINASLKHSNFNVPISRRLSSRLSLSSGVYLSKVGLDVNIVTEEVYKKDITKRHLKSVIQKNSSDGSLSINDASRDVDIVFKPDANLQNGDTVILKARIPIKLNVIQVPLMLNYHFGKGKIEGLLHAGISIDYLSATINTPDFEVFKDGNLITEPLDFEPLKENAFLGTLYFGAGMKYHVNDKFNLGLSTKIDATALVFSRFELGVYYGF